MVLIIYAIFALLHSSPGFKKSFDPVNMSIYDHPPGFLVYICCVIAQLSDQSIWLLYQTLDQWVGFYSLRL